MSSGALRVRVYAGVDVLTGRKLYLKEVVPPGPRVRERAERLRDELLRQVEQGRQARTNASVSQLVARHLEVAEVEPRTLRSLHGHLRIHIGPLIGDRPVGSLSAVVLDGFYAELRRCREHCDGRTVVAHREPGAHECDRRCRPHACRPLAAWTIRKIHYLISSAYENAIRWEWVAVNPMARARKPAPPAADPQPPTPEQAAALVNASWELDLGPFVWLAMTTGARRGELCALRWGNVQIRHTDPGEHDCTTAGCPASLVIRRAIGEGGGRLWETDTKTHQRRHVALDPETIEVLATHRQQCEREAQQVGTWLTDESFVFAAGPDGRQPCTPSSISQRYRRCAVSLGIDTTLKNLRHYSATELITAGVDVRTVAGRLGHSGGGTTTLRVYAAWVAAADQHASSVLMHRMPQRPVAPTTASDPELRAQTTPRSPHEQVAALLWETWRRGSLTAGTELTVKNIVRAHDVSVGTGHRVITLLQRWGVVEVRNGRPSIVLPLPSQVAGAAAAAPAVPPEATPPEVTLPEAVPEPTPPAADPTLLRLDLMHLGTVIRSLTVRADPHDFPTLERLMADAVRRAGGDRDRIGEYELVVHRVDEPLPLATVVIAA